MPDSSKVEHHYTHGNLMRAINAGVTKLGKTTANLSIDDLAPIDEFHIGGRCATRSFLDQLEIDSSHRVLDIGCGLGGSSRFASLAYDCEIVGVDLSEEYIKVGNELCSWFGLSRKISLQVNDATALSKEVGEFDRAYMLHVGMNIANKNRLAAEIYRVLSPGAKLGIYDIMRFDAGGLTYPLPWATDPESSSVASPDTYKKALVKAGFRISSERNRREFAMAFLAKAQARSASSTSTPALGLHILMGRSASAKIANMLEGITRGLLAPVEIIAEK